MSLVERESRQALLFAALLVAFSSFPDFFETHIAI
jgi:hypothetical protein